MADNKQQDGVRIKLDEPAKSGGKTETAGIGEAQNVLRREIEREMASVWDDDDESLGTLEGIQRALSDGELEGSERLQKVQMETAQPQKVQMETAQPRNVQMETARPQRTQEETAQPQRAQEETAQPQRAQEETAAAHEQEPQHLGERKPKKIDFSQPQNMEMATEIGRADSRGRSRSRQNAKKSSADETGFQNYKAGNSIQGKPDKPNGRNKKKGLVAGGILAALLIVCGGAYFVLAQRYHTVFFPNTTINGVDASGKTPEEVKSLIADGIDSYVLTIKERSDETEQITKEDLGLHPVFDGSLEKMVSSQNPYEWAAHLFEPSQYELKTMVSYDETLLMQKLDSLSCMNPALMKAPEDAKISDYSAGGYTIVPEEQGTLVIPDKVKKGIIDAVTNLKTEVSIDDLGGYEAPKVTKDDPGLADLLAQMNRCADVTVTYQFGDKRETLDGSRVHEWLSVNGDNAVSVDPGKVADYVSELAAKYDTYNKAKTLKTSYGPTVTVRGGTYGWRINQTEEAAALTNIILSGESQTREPIYAQQAASHGENDYGTTYVEINLTAQHLFYYKDGALVVESDFVSGNLAKGLGTPTGTFPLNYKQKNAILKGENYRTPVDYWMPFNGGIGMHDASWRSSFGGGIYKNGGSHGCINLPHSVAKKIFESIQPGTPVLCYNLPGTERSGTSSAKPAQPAQPQTEAPPEPAQPEQPSDQSSDQGILTPTQPSGQGIPAPVQPADPEVLTPTQPAGPAAPPPTQSAGPAAPPPTQPSGQTAPLPTQSGAPETMAPPGPGSKKGSSQETGPGAAA